MTRGDKYLLSALLLISLLSAALLYGRFFIQKPFKQLQCVITISGKTYKTMDLKPSTGKPYVFVVHGKVGDSTVEVDGEKIRMFEAPCSGQVCVKQSWISRAGQSIVCMPGEIVIRIEGKAELDGITR